MVSIGAQGHHYHPTGDPGALASGRLSPLLALEIPLLWRPAPNRRGPARADPADERYFLRLSTERLLQNIARLEGIIDQYKAKEQAAAASAAQQT
jgi:hypothetical protein